eukprot:Em0009g1207a
MGRILLSGVQWVSSGQCPAGQPTRPQAMFFYLVLHKLVTAFATDDVCSSLLFHKWYIDDGVVAGPKPAVGKVLSIIQELVLHFGLFINAEKFLGLQLEI